MTTSDPIKGSGQGRTRLWVRLLALGGVFALAGGVLLYFMTFRAQEGEGYGKASWGMTIEVIQQLYPGGTLRAGRDGPEYTVISEVSTRPAIVRFLCDQRSALHGVVVNFPESDNWTSSEAPDRFSAVFRGLEIRYGKPDTEVLQMRLWNDIHGKTAILAECPPYLGENMGREELGLTKCHILYSSKVSLEENVTQGL